MADDHNQRPYRTNDPYGRAGAPAPAAPGDPLAELARLIGQNDPFSEFGRDGAPRRANGRHPQHDAPMDRPAPPVQHYPQAAAQHDPRMQQADQHYPADPNFAADPHYPQQPGYHQPEQGYGVPGYEQQGYAEQPYTNGGADPYYAGHNGQGQQGQDYGYAQQHAPQNARAQGYQQNDRYYDNVHMPAEGEDMYDDAPRPHRRGLLAVAAVVALAVIGTAGAFGYRAIFGSSGSSPPPVIMADSAPSKVVPAGQTADAQSKQIYDRIGTRGERVVSREEQPIDMKDQKTPPRVIFPGPGASASNAPSAQSSLPSSASALMSTEPKKIRTVSIKPDQVGNPGSPQPSMPEPVAVTARSAPVRSTSQPLAMMDTNNGPAPAPRVVAPRAPSPRVANTDPNAPLSLNPEGVSEPAPTMRTASASQTRVAAPTSLSPMAAASTGGAGAYVQVSSQRSENEAQASYQAVAGRFPNVLGGRPHIVRRADLGDKGTYYRAMIGPLSSDQASELCSNLKAAGGDCIVQRN